MVILLTGASGFIGSRLAEALLASGHQVVCATRKHGTDKRLRYVEADFTRDLQAEDWLPRLAGIDAVVNAVGIIRERGAQTFELIHERAPCALFSACARSGVQLVLQVSALGADEQARSRYHLSKKRADDFLAALPVHSVIVQPSLVFGPGGTSARLFTTLASLPLLGLPGGGGQRIQPVHIDDVIAAIMVLLSHPPPSGTRVALVGPEAMRFRDFLAELRMSMGLKPALVLPVPMPLFRGAARIAQSLPGSILDTETLDMLARGNTASPDAITRLLGHPPRDAGSFVPAAARDTTRLAAQLAWLLPLLRLSIAIVWIVTGIVSFGLYPVAESYALLARVGITGWLAPVMLYGAALLDLVFGIATLVLKRRRWLWLGQVAVILFYTAVISWRLPEFWRHPYGPLLKNLPMLAAIWLLLELEER
ncbi:SDR family oxidoreductase [Noviherbaspirillum denitrificans]|uniref:NADH dehydrogenase n=1 Tax=Noviherbaspirillum denitrificans TaxID=1968433 RepID=A0A254TFN6_9BURK|nr:SDR family oxidoreductase [Noviherbaspirillum denitrificans]OWW20142.1 NADH dehydrogenase [Noviherbaspirillum denitrificans]